MRWIVFSSGAYRRDGTSCSAAKTPHTKVDEEIQPQRTKRATCPVVELLPPGPNATLDIVAAENAYAFGEAIQCLSPTACERATLQIRSYTIAYTIRSPRNADDAERAARRATGMVCPEQQFATFSQGSQSRALC